MTGRRSVVADDVDEVVIELPAHIVQALTNGETMSIDIEELRVRVVLVCTDEAVKEFQSAVHSAILNFLQPAAGVH